MSAFESMKATLKGDQEYANSFHDNVSCCAIDEGLEHEQANRVASRVMRLFGIETVAPEGRPFTSQKEEKEDEK